MHIFCKSSRLHRFENSIPNERSRDTDRKISSIAEVVHAPRQVEAEEKENLVDAEAQFIKWSLRGLCRDGLNRA